MNILFNLSPLGAKTRSGISRVAEHLVRGLANFSDHQIYFHALSEISFAERYFKQNLRRPHSHFARSSWRTLVSKHLIPLEDFVQNSESDRRFFMRVSRKVVVCYFSMWTSFLSKVPPDLLKEINIYHSPYRQIPEQIRRVSSIARFTTIYDLMPITHPEFFGRSKKTMVGEIVAGFTKDDFVFCISHATRESLLIHSKCDPEKVFVTHLAAGPFFYVERDAKKRGSLHVRFKIPKGRYFLTLSTLEIRKNLETVIRAYGNLRRSGVIGPDISLVLAGEMGWKTERIDAALREVEEFRDSIVLTGFVPDEDLASLYSNAIAFIFMSRYEGFGLPPLEAMACGTPVITSDTSSLPEVIGNAGIQLNPDDIDGLCAAMQSFATSPEMCIEYSNLALQQSKKFSWDRFICETLAAYQIALDQRNGFSAK